MDDGHARLESAVEQLRLAVQSLEQRVAVLESGQRVEAAAGTGAAGLAQSRQGAPAARAKRDQYDPIVILSLIGRLFLVLAGGFFLRAMTEAGVLSPPVGVALWLPSLL